jgi:hypothetical protein
MLVSHLKHVTEKSSFCTKHKSSVSIRFTEIMPILRILCYNGNLVTWMVPSFTTAKFKPPISSMSGFTLSYTANMFILVILHDFCLLRAQFLYRLMLFRETVAAYCENQSKYRYILWT